MKTMQSRMNSRSSLGAGTGFGGKQVGESTLIMTAD